MANINERALVKAAATIEKAEQALQTEAGSALSVRLYPNAGDGIVYCVSCYNQRVFKDHRGVRCLTEKRAYGLGDARALIAEAKEQLSARRGR